MGLKSARPPSPSLNLPLLYELRIINSGIGDATAKKIIDDLPAEIVRFSLASNNVRTVPVFPTYEYLQYLYLHQNPLETVTAGAFDNLPYVFVISLDFGELESIPAGIFDNNVELDTVYLNNNMLSELPAGLFDKNPYLYEVYLEYNMLSELPVGLFDYNPLLSILILNDNQLTDLPADLLHEIVEQHAVSGLRVIDLSNNLFTELPDGFFDGREYLRELDLGNNRLTSLPDFKDSVRLEVLNLQGNEFEQMLTDFPYLKRLLTFNGVETVRAPADEARLRSLELSRVPLGETFDGANEMYMATTAAGETTVTATPLDHDATTVIKLNGTVDADGTVDLELGSNVITVEVTAEDGTTKKTYTVTVTREAPREVPDTSAIWLATLTVADLGSNQYGYNVEECNLTDTAFTYLGDNASISSNSHFEDWGTLYTIDELAYSAGNFYLSLGWRFEHDTADNISVVVGGMELKFANANYAPSIHTYSWAMPNTSWSTGDEVKVKIVVLKDADGPENLTATTTLVATRVLVPTTTTYEDVYKTYDMTLTWSTPTTGGAVTGYRVEYQPDPALQWQRLQGSRQTGTTYTLSGIKRSVVGYYRVVAQRPGIGPSYSDVVRVQAEPETEEIPEEVGYLVAKPAAGSDTALKLAWNRAYTLDSREVTMDLEFLGSNDVPYPLSNRTRATSYEVQYVENNGEYGEYGYPLRREGEDWVTVTVRNWASGLDWQNWLGADRGDRIQGKQGGAAGPADGGEGSGAGHALLCPGARLHGWGL